MPRHKQKIGNYIAKEITLRAEVDDKFKMVIFSFNDELIRNNCDFKLYVGELYVGNFSSSPEISVPESIFISSNCFDIRLIADSEPTIFNKEGEFFFVTGFDNPKFYYERVQMAGTRVKSRLSIKLGALYSYSKFFGCAIRASALSVYGHRLIDGIIIENSEISRPEIQRYLDLADNILGECAKEINIGSYRWDLIRWSISLATVAGNICIACDKLDLARKFFRFCSINHKEVKISPVSSLNIINGQLMHALISIMLGDNVDGKKTLKNCIVSYKNVVDAQDLLVNVWVIGDLLNSAKSVRQAFILMVQLGFDERNPLSIVDPSSKFEISTLQSPVAQLIQRGYCKDFEAYLSKF